MKKFLTRTIFGFPLWGWLILGAILAFYINKLWILFFGTVPAAVALHQAAGEAQDKADKLIKDSMQSEELLNEKTVETKLQGTSSAEASKQKSKDQQDDTNDPFMD